MENIKPSETSEISEQIKKYSPFIHEIRKRIIITLCIFAISTTLGIVFNERIIRVLIDLLDLKGVNVVFTSPFQFFNLAISCGIASGLVFIFPLLIYQVLSFLKPALKNGEYKMIVRFLPFSIVLFLIGFSFGVMVMKWQIQLFLSKSVSLGIGNLLDVSSLISIVLLVASFMGISFQIPIILFVLLRVGIIKHQMLSKQRLWVYLASFFIAVLLPIDSILADLLLALPLILLFEITLMLNRR